MRNHISRRSKAGKNPVGVRELKTHAARILRQVREARASYILTYRGRAVGVILPLEDPDEAPLSADTVSPNAAWRVFLRAGQRIQGRFRAGAGGVGVLSEMRR